MNHRLSILQEAQYDFWFNNLAVLKEFMKGLKDKNVDLSTFNHQNDDGSLKKPKIEHTCGSVACIGGWVAVMPHFKALGIKREKREGYPKYGSSEDGNEVTQASEFLFGVPDMFESRDDDYEDDLKSDREIAIRRIKKRMKAIAKLEAARQNNLTTT